jgi:hypothetical protein
MAKKKLSHKEMKRQKKRQMARVRDRQSWEQQNEPRIDKLDALMPIMGDTQEETLANMMNALMESSTLIVEEEFESLFFPPLESVDVFIQIAQEKGWSPEALKELDGTAVEDVHFDIIQECVPKLLTEEMKQEILQALQDCHGRLQKQGKGQKAAQVGIVQFVLSEKEMNEVAWQMTALVHSLVRRSVAAGFSLMETTGLGERELPALDKILDAAATEGVTKKVEGLLKRVPGLRGYLEKQTDAVWDEGAEAVYLGKLYLGLFAEEEVQIVAGLIDQFVKPAFEEKATGGTVQESLPRFIEELDAYISQIFSNPERLRQIRHRIDTLLQEQAVERQWVPFVYLLKGYMADDEAAINERAFLHRALMGEFYAHVLEDEAIVHE